jgi:hypothetical protein
MRTDSSINIHNWIWTIKDGNIPEIINKMIISSKNILPVLFNYDNFHVIMILLVEHLFDIV